MGEKKIISCAISECYSYDNWCGASSSFLTQIAGISFIDIFIFSFIFQDVNPSFALPSPMFRFCIIVATLLIQFCPFAVVSYGYDYVCFVDWSLCFHLLGTGVNGVNL
jgi:hypothetical protein